jgi:hypothetical protein
MAFKKLKISGKKINNHQFEQLLTIAELSLSDKHIIVRKKNNLILYII